jgi:outer membrane protein assembly factor BamB
VTKGVVYVGSQDNKLYAFDATDGSLLWAAATAGSVKSSPAVANGVVYVGSYDGKLYAYAQDGEVPMLMKGSFHPPEPVGLEPDYSLKPQH